MKQKRTATVAVLVILAVFFVGNLCFLTQYPFVHSDEPWLAGLTRNMMEQRSLGVTETFFDLKPRYPHAVKSIFHLLQMPLIALFGYGAFSVRLLSLLGGTAALWLFYCVAKKLCNSKWNAVLCTALLACDVQFIASSHLARQEILLVNSILLCLWVLCRTKGPCTNHSIVLLAVITGLSVGLHPNSFLVAAMCGAVLFLRWLLFRTVNLRQMLYYIGITGAIALVFVGISFLFDPQFPVHYLAYGESEFDLIVPVTNKFLELGNFFKKLFYSASGTYYVPNLKLHFVFAPLVLGVSILRAVMLFRSHKVLCEQVVTLLAAFTGLLAGTVFIGRYNQTGIVFFIPVLFLLLVSFLDSLQFSVAAVTSALMVICWLWVSVTDIAPWLCYHYEDYLTKIAQTVPSDVPVLANLNAEFGFDNGTLHDWRNLAYLKDQNMSVSDYVTKHDITYIIYSDELDFIYSVRPKWNIIYGNLGYLPELKEYLDTNCQQIASFVDNTYGVRIREQMNTARDFTVTIYRVGHGD